MAFNGILPKSMAELFWPKVAKAGPDECWNWTAGLSSGYGSFTVRQNGKVRPIRSHVASWELHNGPVPAGLSVLHKCDNPRCCNPNHLFIGTAADNMHDAVSKGRHAHGSKASYSKLTEEQVQEARALYGEDGKIKRRGSLKELAERFGVALPTLSTAVHHKWKHVGPSIERKSPEFQPVSPATLTGRNGERNPNSKLTIEQVNQMRLRHSEGATAKELAEAYGISQRTVYGILSNKNWRNDLSL